MSSPQHGHNASQREGLSPSTPRPRVHQAPTQRLPPTALFQGPNSRNTSHASLAQPEWDRTTPVEKQQHLPRAGPPTTTFSDARPSLVGGLQNPTRWKKEDEFRADALWAEMQKTLADVELSAMNSSHVFSSAHAKALEELRMAQLGLSQAWAKSEADEMRDEEFGDDEPEASAVGTMKHGMFGSHSPSSHKNRSRPGSASSAVGRNLEEETERDIRLARRRREANDRYFQQVNTGVLDVVSKLDEVANAMRRVERESRDIWNDSSGTEDPGELTDSGHDDAVIQTDAAHATNLPAFPKAKSPTAQTPKSKGRSVDTPSSEAIPSASSVSKSPYTETPSSVSRPTDTPRS